MKYCTSCHCWRLFSCQQWSFSVINIVAHRSSASSNFSNFSVYQGQIKFHIKFTQRTNVKEISIFEKKKKQKRKISSVTSHFLQNEQTDLLTSSRSFFIFFFRQENMRTRGGGDYMKKVGQEKYQKNIFDERLTLESIAGALCISRIPVSASPSPSRAFTRSPLTRHPPPRRFLFNFVCRQTFQRPSF